MINEAGYWTLSQSEVIISDLPGYGQIPHAVEIPILPLSVCTVCRMCIVTPCATSYTIQFISLLSVSDRYVLFYKLNAYVDWPVFLRI